MVQRKTCLTIESSSNLQPETRFGQEHLKNLGPEMMMMKRTKPRRKLKDNHVSSQSGKSQELPKHDLVVKVIGGSPNYMKGTSSSEARKENKKRLNLSRNQKNQAGLKHDSRYGVNKERSYNKPSSRIGRGLTKAPSFKRCSQRATCSSTLKDSKFPEYLMLNHGETFDQVNGTSVLKVCPYTYCSLNGHLHSVQYPPLKSDAVINPRTNHGEDYGRYQNRGLILSYLLKGEPPDVPSITKHQSYQGKTLSSQKRMKANLLSLGAGDLVSRSKLRQEGEYDEDIKSSSAQDQGITERWNWFKSFPHEKDIQVTSQQTSNEPNGDQQLLIGGFRPNQKDLSYKVNFRTLLTHQRSFSNWNQVNTDFGLEDINFLNQMMLSLTYLEADGFNYLQTKLWRPGEFLLQLETPKITSSFILSPWIKWIQSFLIIHQELPYMDPRAFKAQPQRLSSDLVRLKGVIRRLISHGIIQKLSRYKIPRITPFGLSIQSLTAIFFQGTSPLDFFDLFRVLLSYFESLDCCTNPRVEPI